MTIQDSKRDKTPPQHTNASSNKTDKPITSTEAVASTEHTAPATHATAAEAQHAEPPKPIKGGKHSRNTNDPNTHPIAHQLANTIGFMAPACGGDIEKNAAILQQCAEDFAKRFSEKKGWHTTLNYWELSEVEQTEFFQGVSMALQIRYGAIVAERVREEYSDIVHAGSLNPVFQKVHDYVMDDSKIGKTSAMDDMLKAPGRIADDFIRGVKSIIPGMH